MWTTCGRKLARNGDSASTNEQKYLTTFRQNMQDGIEYYRTLVFKMTKETERYREIFAEQLQELELDLQALVIPMPEIAAVPV